MRPWQSANARQDLAVCFYGRLPTETIGAAEAAGAIAAGSEKRRPRKSIFQKGCFGVANCKYLMPIAVHCARAIHTS